MEINFPDDLKEDQKEAIRKYFSGKLFFGISPQSAIAHSRRINTLYKENKITLAKELEARLLEILTS